MNHIEFYSSNLSNEKLLHNNNNANISNTNIINKKNINIYGINKNLFNESNNDHSRIQSDRVISNNQIKKIFLLLSLETLFLLRHKDQKEIKGKKNYILRIKINHLNYINNLQEKIQHKKKKEYPNNKM